MDGATNGNPADLHDRRLMALLRDLVREKGRARTAEALAVDPRTLAACLKRGKPSRLMRAALERRLDAGSQSQQDTGSLEREARVLREAVTGELKVLREEQAEALGQLERRLEQLESGQHSREAPPAQEEEAVVVGPPPRAARQSDEGMQEAPDPDPGPAVQGASRQTGHPGAESGQQPEPAKKSLPARLYPELVTEDPAPDDEEVYGEAWPLVEEWRRLWQAHVRPAGGLEWLRRAERILELEVAMLEEHRLTLPPATFPQRGIWRHGQLGWRWKALRDARRARAWGEARHWAGRLLSAGLLLGLTALVVLVERSSTPG
ncbi:MAG: hypothetical protein OXS47_12215 [Chloroflexota bacterium]|nr:hypothetical protein [Chloroflexota bacterium]